METGYVHAADILKALGHPVRLHIADILSRQEACVCNLSARLGYRQPYISQQLAELRQAGLLSARRDGGFTFYRLRDARLAGLIALARTLAGEDSPGVCGAVESSCAEKTTDCAAQPSAGISVSEAAFNRRQ